MAYPELKCYIGDQQCSIGELETWFGHSLDIRRADPFPGAPIVRVVKLRGLKGITSQNVEMFKEDGSPWEKAAIGRWWEDAPGLDPFPPNCLATRWKNNAMIGFIEGSGVVGFGMGTGDAPGSSGVFPIHCPAPGDAVFGLGLMRSPEYRCVQVTFQEFATDPDPDPGPDPEPGDGYLERIAVALERIAAKL